MAERLTLLGHSDGVSTIGFSPRGEDLASGSEDGTVRLWSIASGQEVATLRGHDREVCAIAFSPEGQLLASAGGDGAVKLWDLAMCQPRSTLEGHQRVVSSVRVRAAWRFDRDGGMGQNCQTLEYRDRPVAARTGRPYRRSDGRGLFP